MKRELAAGRYDTDKDEGYLRRYTELFEPICDAPVKLLEIGVLKGGSLEMWRDYFASGEIIGLDIDPRPAIADMSRIRVYGGSQDNVALLDRIAQENAPEGFDIIIDDAAHIGVLAKRSFWHLFEHHLKPGGIYVIEDWGTGYWDLWPDGSDADPHARDHNAHFPSHSAGMVGLVKQLVDECGAADMTHPTMTNAKLPPRRSRFERVTVAPGQVFVVKAS